MNAFGPARRSEHDNMKQKLIRPSQRHVTALKKLLKQGAQAILPAALGLARQTDGHFSLKWEAQGNAKGLKNEIASPQRLVVKSARSVRRFACELNTRQPA